MKQPPAPFSCTYSPNLPEMLVQLDCTIALSTYQAGKVVLISANGPDELIQLPRNFTKAMGMAVDQDRLGVATKEEIIVLANSKGLAASYPPQTGTYDGLFVPRASYYCGEIDVHDMAWGEEGLYAVNTRFSCLSLIDDFFLLTQGDPQQMKGIGIVGKISQDLVESAFGYGVIGLLVGIYRIIK